ncbi:MAG: hypothetical protein AAGD33_08755 [Actinomycetota bacterium]
MAGAAIALAAGCSSDSDDADDPAAALSDADLTGGEGRELAAEAAAPLDGGVIVDEASPATTLAIIGSASELLPDIGIEISRLSAVIGTQEGIDTITRIRGMWDAIGDEVAQTRPDLVNGIETTIGVAISAAESGDAAGADAAFAQISDFIDDYVGDA